jgi:hypothetical protein
VRVLDTLPFPGGDDVAPGQRPLALPLLRRVVERHASVWRVRSHRLEPRLGVLEFRSSARDLAPLHSDLGLRDLELGARLRHPRLVHLRLDSGDHLVLGDDGIEVGIELVDPAGELRADRDDDECVERPCGADRLREVPALDKLCPINRHPAKGRQLRLQSTGNRRRQGRGEPLGVRPNLLGRRRDCRPPWACQRRHDNCARGQ